MSNIFVTRNQIFNPKSNLPKKIIIFMSFLIISFYKDNKFLITTLRLSKTTHQVLQGIRKCLVLQSI